jgi:acetylornithine aminotransferase
MALCRPLWRPPPFADARGSPMNAPEAVKPPPAASHVMNTYGRLPFALSHGRGCRVWDTEGREYLDALGGIAVNTLGHAIRSSCRRCRSRSAKLIHCSNYYQMPLQEQLAAKLCELSGLTNAFFCSTGLEANEAALKIARKFGHDRGIERPEIVVYEKAFHGRSIATLSATGNAKVQAGFGPLVEGFVRVPLNDVAAIEEVADTQPNVVAVFLEVIQGEGGINRPRSTTCSACAGCATSSGLAADARRGAVRHRPHRQVVRAPVGRHPADVMPLAKGLGSGVPVGAVVCGPRARQRAGPGQPRHHLRRQPARDARRPRDAAHHGRGPAARERGHGGQRCCARPAREAGRAWPAWSRSAARA